jgi:hypothetical protein
VEKAACVGAAFHSAFHIQLAYHVLIEIDPDGLTFGLMPGFTSPGSPDRRASNQNWPHTLAHSGANWLKRVGPSIVLQWKPSFCAVASS